MTRPEPKWQKRAKQRRLAESSPESLRNAALKTHMAAAAEQQIRRLCGFPAGGTTTASSNTATSADFNMGDLTRLMAEMEALEMNLELPFRAMLAKAGMDPDHDCLIIPRDIPGYEIEEHHLPRGMRDRIHLTRLALLPDRKPTVFAVRGLGYMGAKLNMRMSLDEMADIPDSGVVRCVDSGGDR